MRAVQRKSDVPQVLANIIRWCETQTGKRVCCVRSDRGGEFTAGCPKAFYAERGIERELTAGYTPQANGLPEAVGGVLANMARTLLSDSDLGNGHWADAVTHANDLRMCMPSTRLVHAPARAVIELLVAAACSQPHQSGVGTGVIDRAAAPAAVAAA